MAFPNTSTSQTYDGYCGVRDLVTVHITEKTRENQFGTVKTWKVSYDIISVGICEKKDSWTGNSVRMSNQPTDEYATATIHLKRICQECDTSCSKAGRIGRTHGTSRGSGGLPSEFRKLRDSLNGQCYDLGKGRDISESLRTKIGRDTMDSETAINGITDALTELLGQDVLDSVLVDCENLNCGCGDDDPPRVYSNLANPINN